MALSQIKILYSSICDFDLGPYISSISHCTLLAYIVNIAIMRPMKQVSYKNLNKNKSPSYFTACSLYMCEHDNMCII